MSELPAKPKRSSSQPPADPSLPLFSRRRTVTPSPRKSSPWRWLAPFTGLILLVSGIIQLIPRGDDPLIEPRPPVDRSFPTIVVDAGHGGSDHGASANGLREKDLTLDVALRLERQLRLCGFPVILTRRHDHFISLEQRSIIANKVPRALFVSIHFNDSSPSIGAGIETFYASEKILAAEGWSLAGMFRKKPEPPPADNGAALAQKVQSEVVAKLGMTDRGAKPQALYVVRHTRCAAILVEGGFLNNPTEAKRIATPPYREQLASAIAAGVLHYHDSQL